MWKERSKSLALSTRSASVASCGDRVTSFCWSTELMHFLNAYILVLSSTPKHQAWWLQSLYQSLNSRLPIYVSCRPLMASCWTSGGMNCFSKAILNWFQVPSLLDWQPKLWRYDRWPNYLLEYQF